MDTARGAALLRKRITVNRRLELETLLRNTIRIVVLAAAVVLVALPTTASPLSGTHKWAVVLCNFSNHTAVPSYTSSDYYERMFEGGGSGDFQRYWTDNSYGNLSAAGTTVTGWHTLGITRGAWVALDRDGKRQRCADKAAADGFDFSGYYGFMVIYPEAKTTLASTIDTTQTTIPVASTNSTDTDRFPTTPFQMWICTNADCSGAGESEIVNVTAISGTTFTVQRGQGGTSAQTWLPGTLFIVPGELFAQAPIPWTIGGKPFTLAAGVLPSDVNMAGAAHEFGHGYALAGAVLHSRKLSTPTQEYGDCYDIMSAYATCSFEGVYGGSNIGSIDKAAGPGITGILLNQQGWLAGARIFDVDNSSCNQTTMDLVALNQNGITGRFVARIPAVLPILNLSAKYWLEYREATGWDQAVPAGVVVHVEAGGTSYWVDTAGTDGRLEAGDSFAPADQKTYVTVHELDTAAHKAQITIAGCKIDTSLDYAGDTSGEYSDSVTLAADLGVSGSDAPLPFRTIAFQLGSQTCSASADADGHAECSITLDQVPGSYTVGASFAGSGSLEPASDSASFTIEKEKTALAYGGPTEKDYHDVFTAKATLLDEENVPVPGRAVAFTLGATDTCSDNTDGLGVAECSVAPNQVPGSYTMTAAFAGDAYYEPSSDADSFTITKEETVTTYNGPTVILQGASGVTLAARLLEGGPADTDGDGSTAPTVPSGQTVTLRLGSQSCSDTVDASGSASCTLTFTGALGSQPLEAEFGGDAYYLPSADTGKTAIVFAFPSRGAFVLGDNTVAAATPTSAVTWWDDAWWRLNSVSSGVAPDSFKGFAGSVATLPTTSPANACGTTFRTLPGNSPPPTSGVPSYMGVLVASSVTKSGNAINGRWGKIVVVRTNAGYAPNPGRPGTGTIVATFCP